MTCLELEVYKNALNGVLPTEIRILNATYVPSNFSARFNCKYREYHYYFIKRDLDIELMRTAGMDLVGVHDFRNFCKLNVLNTTNYEREIMDVKVEKCEFLEFNPYTPHPGASGLAEGAENFNNPLQLYYVRIRANAFLWHQIRCILTVLFNVGMKLDPPTVVKDLLDIEKTPRRPGYQFADPENLVLSDCVFEPDIFEGTGLDGNNYNSYKDPANVYGAEVENVLIRGCISGMMLRKRDPDPEKFRIVNRASKLLFCYLGLFC